MRRNRSLALAVLATAALLTLLVALPLAAARATDDPLALIPANAAAVGMVRLNDLRTSPLSARLFSETDRMTADGDAARFMEEANLRPKEDVDTVVFATTSPAAGAGPDGAVVFFEGRFEVERLSAAVASRGGIPKSARGGDYFLVPDHQGHNGDGAVAFVSRHLVIAGSEGAVQQALAARDAGGSGFLSGAGLGRQLSRIETGATAWALVDMSHWPGVQNARHAHAESEGNGTPVTALVGAMKSVSHVALQATVKGDALKLSAVGVCGDDETRELLEDALRGVLATWRLAVQDKSPDMVSVLRKFKVQRDRETVSVSGTLPGAAVRALAEKGHARKAEATE